MLVKRLSFSRRRDRGARKDTPRTPSPTNTDQDSSEYDSMNTAASPYTLKGCVLKKHISGTLDWAKWGKRWLEVDDELGCLLYYKTFTDQVRSATRLLPLPLSRSHAGDTLWAPRSDGRPPDCMRSASSNAFRQWVKRRSR